MYMGSLHAESSSHTIFIHPFIQGFSHVDQRNPPSFCRGGLVMLYLINAGTKFKLVSSDLFVTRHALNEN